MVAPHGVGISSGADPVQVRDSPYPMRNALPLLVLASLLALLAAGCNGELIPNTDVPDTAENREAILFVEQYRHAVERRDVGEILSLVSPRFYDDNGTPTTEDDRDYDRLREELASVADRLLDVRYEMRYRRVTHRPDRILVDYTYTSSFKIATPQGDRWETRLNDNRIELVREDGKLRILSGI
jgi:hypothetical protein